MLMPTLRRCFYSCLSPSSSRRNRRRAWSPEFLEQRMLLTAEWTQRGGDAQHTNYQDVTLDPASLVQSWNQPLNYAQSGTGSWWERAVAIDANHVYRTDLEGYAPVGTYRVFAYNRATGSLVWQRSFIGNSFEGVGEPSVANGVVYVNRSGHSGISGGTSSDLPRIYGLDAATGNTVVERTYAAQWGSNERPVIMDGQMVVEDGYYGGISGYSLPSMTRTWFVGRGAAYDPPYAALDDEFAYAFGNEVYRRSNGQKLANITHPLGYSVSGAMVAQSGRVIFAGSGYINGASRSAVYAVDGNTHAVSWTYEMPAGYFAPGIKAVGNGMVAFVSGNKLFVLNEANGSLLSTWQAPANLTNELILTNGHAFVQSVSSGAAKVYAVNLATGTQVWSHSTTTSSDVPALEMAMAGDQLVLSGRSFVRSFTPGNLNPTAGDDTASTQEDSSVSIAVLGNDTDPEGQIVSLVSASQPSHGTVSVDTANGSVTYVPTADFHGSDTFTYIITDGNGGIDSAVVTITVVGVNDLPVADADSATTDEDSTVVIDILAGDVDVDGDSLAITSVTSPSNGSVTIQNGAAVYSPNANFFGTDAFTYIISDGQGGTASASVSITVNSVQDAPVARAGLDQTAAEASVVVFDGTSSSDVDGDSLSWQWNFGDGVTASGSVVSHAFADNGLYTVILIVSDGQGNSTTDTLEVAVSNVAPVAGIAGPSGAVRGQVRIFSVTGSDVSSADQTAGFLYSVNWGDGSLISTVSGGASASISHAWSTTGNFQIQVTVTDKDNGTSEIFTKSVTILAAEIQGDVLMISGTNSNDVISVTPTSTGTGLVVSINSAVEGTFSGAARIQIDGLDGSDTIRMQQYRVGKVTRALSLPSVINAGAGDDIVDVTTASGNNVLIGADGNDSLVGGANRDILIGGMGSDTLRSGSEEDILIGSKTIHDNNLIALQALMAEWNRRDSSYGVRIDRITGTTSGGLNGSYLLNSSTVLNDNAVDQFFGNKSADWFILHSGASADVLNDLERKLNERWLVL